MAAHGDPNLTQISNLASDAQKELSDMQTSLDEIADTLTQAGLPQRGAFVRQLVGRLVSMAKDQGKIVDLCNNITQPITLDLE
jgi:argininosuccinate lyase